MKKIGKFLNVCLSVILALSLSPVSGVASAYAGETTTDLTVGSASAAAQGETAATAQSAAQPAETDPDTQTATLTAAVATTGGGSATLTADGKTGASLTVATGTTVTVTPQIPDGSYLAQVRYAKADTAMSTEEQTTFGVYTALAASGTGTYSFTMPDAAVQVCVDYISIVWDGTMDVTWYNADSKIFRIQYPAQYAGLAAIVNGIFTTYPTQTVVDDAATGASHEVPSYQTYQSTMGMKYDASNTYLGSNLYGAFTAQYSIVDTQSASAMADYTRSTVMTVTQRVVGDATAIHAYTSTGDSGGPNGSNLATTDDYWYGADDFDGKTVYIVADLDFGGFKDTAGNWSTQSPLFMPVAGQYSVLPGTTKTNGYSKLSASFNGTLDGLGHKFTNVYCEHYADTEYGDSQSVGLVGRLGNHDGDYSTWNSTDGKEGNYPALNPTVRQIVLESGYISARRTSGGIVGKIGHTSATELKDGSTGGIVEYCINKATVFGTDKKGIGGIVGAAWNNGVIRCCANFGSVTCLTEGSGFLAGGIAGSCEVPVQNCYNVGTVHAGGSAYSEAIGSYNGGSCTWDNCYYLTGSDGNTSTPGVYKGNGADTVYAFGTGTSITQLTASQLNNGGAAIWKDDTTGINAAGGVNYPILYAQAKSFDPTFTYTITCTQPTEGGTFTASATSGTYAQQISLAATPEAGYALDYYLVNDKQVSGNTFVLDSDSTVTAVFRKLTSATFTLTNDSDVYQLSATKTGYIIQSEKSVPVYDYPLLDGDTVYEGDVITYSATLKEGVVPADADTYYNGTFTYLTYTVNYPTTSSSKLGQTYTVTTNDVNICGTVQKAGTAYKHWNSEADCSWYNYNDPQTSYTLTTAAQLAGLADLVEEGLTFKGVTITLGADISLANTDGTTGIRQWTPIGYVTATTTTVTPVSSFQGTFDGAGYVISDMTVSKSVTDYVGAARGLFGCISGATIKNVQVTGSITTASANNVAGGIVGYSVGGSKIENCTSGVTISGSGLYSGGVIGRSNRVLSEDGAAVLASDVIAGCVFSGSVAGAGSTTTGIGGIVGYALSTQLRNCSTTAGATVSVTGTSGNAGGLVGYSVDTQANQCANAATVTCSATSGYAGGLAGYTLSSSGFATGGFSQCLNEGAVAGTAAYAAGLVGYVKGRLTLDNCGTTGTVDTTKSTGTAVGMVGYLAKEANLTDAASVLSISNSYTASTLSSKAVGKMALLVGYYASGTITSTNLHYLSGTATALVYTSKGSSVPTATAHNEAGMKAAANTLGSVWATADADVNSGYPILAFMAHVYSIGATEYAPGYYLVTYTGSISAGQIPVVTVGGVAHQLYYDEGVYGYLLSGSEAQALTDASFSLVSATAERITRTGDLNGNGKVNIVDVQIDYDMATGQYANTFDTLSMATWLAADINADYVLDASDARALQYFMWNQL